MSVPDQRALVAHVFAQGGHVLTTKEGAGKFTEAAAAALHRLDENFGHLRKPAGRTHVVDAQGNRHAVDVVLYKATGQIVDIIRDAGEPGAALSWGEGEEGEYTVADWYAPAAQDLDLDLPEKPPAVDVAAEFARLRQQITVLQGTVQSLIHDVASQKPCVPPDYVGTASGKLQLPVFGERTVTLDVTLRPKP